MREEDLSFFQEEEFKQHLAQYEQMLQGGPSVYLESDELTDIAEYYLTQNEFDKANECIDYALKLHPGSVDPMIFRARQAMFAGELDEATQICDSIPDQSDREVIFLKGELIIRKNSLVEAESFFYQEAQKLKDDTRELSDFYYDCACIMEDYGNYPMAIRWLDMAEKTVPEQPKVTLQKAEVNMMQEHFDQAVRMLDAYLDNDPYSIKAWNMLADCNFMSKNYEAALEATDFSLAINEEKNPNALFIKANCFYHQGLYEKAHQAYQKFIRKFPKTDEYPYLFDGLCLSQMERYEDACNQLVKAEKFANGYSEEQLQIYMQLAFSYSKLGKFNLALNYLDRAEELDSDEFNFTTLRGHILLENGFAEEAAACFQKAKETEEDAGKTLFLIAVSYFENRMYADALENFHELMAAGNEENNKVCYPYVAFCYYVAKDEKHFLEYLKLACETNPQSTKMILGDIFPESLNPSEYYTYLTTRK